MIKVLVLVMVFSSAAMADKLMVDITSDTNEEANKSITFVRPPETTNVFNRNKQFFDLGVNDVKCDVSFFDSKAVIGCQQTKDNKDRMSADNGFQVATVADCGSGKDSELSFSNKVKKGGFWASFKIKIKCIQEKI